MAGAAQRCSLVGRRLQLEELRQSLIAADAAPRTVLVWGEPGIGKSRPVDEVFAEPPVDCRVLVGGCALLSRIVRAEFLSLREREYVEAARALGASGPRIVLKHLIPNSLSQIVVWSTLGAAGAIGAEAALSFLGYGVQGSDTSLGRLVATARPQPRADPGCSTSPGWRC